MSNRERWILYPLVFLSLGLGLRDRFLQFDTRTVAARDVQAQLVNSNAVAAKQMRVENGHVDTITCRRLVVLGGGTGATKSVVLSANDLGEGLIQVADAHGKSQVTLVATADGGYVRTLSADGKPLVLLDKDPEGAGRIGVYDKNNLLFFVRPTIGPFRTLEVPDAPPVTEQAPEGDQPPQAPPAVPPATEPQY